MILQVWRIESQVPTINPPEFLQHEVDPGILNRQALLQPYGSRSGGWAPG